MKVLKRVVFFLVILFPFPGTFSFANPMDALRGLEGFKLIIEDIAPHIKNFALTEKEVRRIVEAKIRLENIKMFPEDGKKRASFHVLVQGGHYREYKNVIYNIKMELRQKVNLADKPGLSFYAPTWSRGFVGIIPDKQTKKAVKDSVLDLLDYFLKDFRAVNPE